MNKIASIKALLDSVRLSEGDKFNCDKITILEEYYKQEENKSRFAVKVFSIFASLCVLFLFTIGVLFLSEITVLIFGIAFIISGIGLNKAHDEFIIETLSASLYVIGFVLLAVGLTEMYTDQISAIVISLIAISSLIVTQNFILSFFSVLAMSGSFILIISKNSYDFIHLYIAIYSLILTYIFLNEAKILSSNKKLSQLYNPIRIGVIISLLFGLIAIGKRNLIPISQSHIWLSSIIMIFVVIYLVYNIIKINEINTLKSKIMIYALSALILASTILSPSILGAIIIILLSFFVNYKTGLAIGIISIIYFVSQYYYDLNITLFTKSIILFVTGIMFLCFYLFTPKKLGTNEKI